MGKQIQVPPVFSAVKVNGKRAYDMARSGEEEIAVRSKEIDIKLFEMAKAGDLDALREYEQRKRIEQMKQKEAIEDRNFQKKYMKKWLINPMNP